MWVGSLTDNNNNNNKRPRSRHDSSDDYDIQSDISFSGEERRESKDWKTRPKNPRPTKDDNSDISDTEPSSKPTLENKYSDYCMVLKDLKEAYPLEFLLKPAPSPKGLINHAIDLMEENQQEEHVRVFYCHGF